ncbi:MAG: hypothetical protein ACUVS2_04280 [Candidatus Flexifilum sp.]|jgi:hypothetical protein
MTPAGQIGFKPGYLFHHARYWLPPLLAGAAAWLAFMVIGDTPLLRASGLALVIIGMGFILRPMGAALTLVGALALAFTPSFWIQTGGAESLVPAEVLGAGAIALLGAGGAWWLLRRLAARPVGLTGSQPLIIAGGLAIAVFGVLFVFAVGQPRSLRLTTLTAVWTLFLLIDGLFVSNPRPDSPPVGRLGLHHTYGLLILALIGVLNDPLFVLFVPALGLGLFLTDHRLPILYWLALIGISAAGAVSLIQTYAASDWWGYSPALAEMQGLQVPYLIGNAWRESSRWLKLIELVANQFGPIGLGLGIIGLARLARWYPPVGVVTMIAYGSFGVFGLLYFGADASTLLLPLLMIQLVWMTYAVYAFGQWLQKSTRASGGVIRLVAPAVFALLPLALLLRIAGV